MKQRMLVVLFACAAMMASIPSVVRAQVDISANVDIQINSPSDFYQPLESYGTWVDVPSYGRCWRPRSVEADWQPYTDGHWEWTDAGWYWVSDEPWGWACFHYGSWEMDPSYGWVWIPGTEWAPAWVTWRYSDDYIGWAPCGPNRAVLAPSFFTFCDVHRFRGNFHNRRDFIVNNTTIINRTRVINDFHRQSIDFDGRQRTVFANRGPGIDPIRRATGQDFQPRPIREVIRESRRPENMRRDENQRRDQRPTEQRRETPPPTGRDQQRNYQQQPDNREQQNRQRNQEIDQRRETPAPTGRDQQRNYQQPDTRDQQRRDQPPSVNPTLQQQNRDRERESQQRQLQQQQQQRQQELKTPQTPEGRPEATPTERTAPQRPLPPTGRDNNVRPAQPERREVTPPTREPQQVPRPAAPEQHREVPTPATPAERPLPPTGRNEVHPATPERPTPPARAPEARPTPPVREAPAATAPGRQPDDGRGRDRRDGNQ
jgi:uncharacterized protein DUF6600